jgi:hypothetical protein
MNLDLTLLVISYQTIAYSEIQLELSDWTVSEGTKPIALAQQPWAFSKPRGTKSFLSITCAARIHCAQWEVNARFQDLQSDTRSSALLGGSVLSLV